MVIMTQDFATRYPYVWGHGNWGSIDGDSAAAMRYTEAKFDRYGQAMLKDINKNTIDFIPNFDESEMEPQVLPGLIPNLLANGSFGIAVGMTSKIAPHNLTELYDAINYIIDCTLEDKEPTVEDIMQYVKAPDFPTGGQILGLKGVRDAYTTGSGKITVRSKYHIETEKNTERIIITEIPYKVNKANLIESIRDVAKTKIEGISEVSDESDKDGMRIVIELKRDANTQLIINNLLKNTKMQDDFSYNSLAIVNGEPKVLDLLAALNIFLEHAAEVIIRRSKFDLDKSNKRLNIVEGILKCTESEEMFVKVTNLIKHSEDPIKAMQTELGFNEAQATHIFDMKLRTLSITSHQKLIDEKELLEGNVVKFTEIINDDMVLLTTMKEEFNILKDKFGDERRTEIVAGETESIEDEDLIKDEMLIINISSDGLIKSVEEKEYKTQGRGGKGVKVAKVKDDEIVKYMLSVNSKDNILFFTNHGRCHTLKAYKIDKSSRTARGKSLANYINLEENESIVSVLACNLKDTNRDILFCTVYGTIKRLPLTQLSSRFSVTRVIGFKEGDSLQSAIIVEKEDQVLITTALGHGIRIAMNTEGTGQIRPMGRTAAGVNGIKLSDLDFVVDVTTIQDDSTIFTITEKGLGKRTSADQWPTQNRGGKGVITHKVNNKTGMVVAVTTVANNDELFVATEQGLVTRINVDKISTFGRSTSGVKIMNLNEGDKIVSISKGNSEEEEEQE